MRLVIQRSTLPAEVRVDDLSVGKIEKGLIIYIGVEDADNDEDIDWLSNKILNLRIFNDDQGKMNLSVTDIQGGLLVISQFTLFASTKKGNRPSYLRSSGPEFATRMYEAFLKKLREKTLLHIASGTFGAHMEVDYINDGPVTIVIDSKNKE